MKSYKWSSVFRVCQFASYVAKSNKYERFFNPLISLSLYMVIISNFCDVSFHLSGYIDFQISFTCFASLAFYSITHAPRPSSFSHLCYTRRHPSYPSSERTTTLRNGVGPVLHTYA